MASIAIHGVTSVTVTRSNYPDEKERKAFSVTRLAVVGKDGKTYFIDIFSDKPLPLEEVK